MRSETSTRVRLGHHVSALKRCTTCPNMQRPAVSGGAIVSKVLLVGQAPGDREPTLGRPFAWTAGRTLFRWFSEATGLDEATFRSSIYMAAVCRCFPGKKARGGDRVPTPQEIANCSGWLEAEFQILRPDLVIPVGKLAIGQFAACSSLSDVVGRQIRIRFADHETDVIPLPHPSGASPWPRMEPGKSLLQQALRLIAGHPALGNIKALSLASSREQTPAP
jgi:uracil-DNA glycosylase